MPVATTNYAYSYCVALVEESGHNKYLSSEVALRVKKQTSALAQNIQLLILQFTTVQLLGYFLRSHVMRVALNYTNHPQTTTRTDIEDS